MALSKELKVVGIAILKDNSVKVSTNLVIKDGEEVVVEKPDYYLLSKDADGNYPNVSNEDAKVQAVCKIAWK